MMQNQYLIWLDFVQISTYDEKAQHPDEGAVLSSYQSV